MSEEEKDTQATGQEPAPAQNAQTQVDIDGCYEGAHAVHVIEAKVGAITNTNIRQLLYPKRMIEQTYITSNKPVNAWLLNYTGSDKIFRVYKFVDDADNFRFDIEQSKRYILKWGNYVYSYTNTFRFTRSFKIRS